MSAPLLHVLAAQGRTGVLLAVTALAATALVGGGAVALQSVSSASPAASAATTDDPGSNGRGAERRSDKAQAATSGKNKDRVAAVPFTCDPTKSHGQNVSAYVHSLPKGPGRGRLVSEVASSDCGKTVGEKEKDEAPDAQGAAPKAKKSTPADGGKAPADVGKAPADAGKAPADVGKAPADAGKAPADAGKAPADPDGTTPAKDKPAKAGKAPTPR